IASRAYTRGDCAGQRSEDELASYLDDAGSSLEGRDEIGRINVYSVRHEQIGVIEDIVKFSSNLKVGLLTDPDAFVNAEIEIPETRSAEEIAPDGGQSGGEGREYRGGRSHSEVRCRDEIEPVGDSRIRDGTALPGADGAQIDSGGNKRARARRFGRQRSGAIKHGEREASHGLEDSGHRPAAEKPPTPAAVAAAATAVEEIRDFPHEAADEAVPYVEI